MISGYVLPKTILVPTDLSEGAEEALDYALDLAAALGAQVHLLNVVGIPSLGVPELGLAMASVTIDTVVVENQKAIDELAARKRTIAPIGQAILRTGDAKDTILQVAKELGADLIVMGTHGRRGIKRALLGSIAELVVRTAACPVLTVRTSDAAK